ncbi:MAG: hypothetical protein KDD22_03490 [Bdellovibrionales bacterium]|nr:hypothetical protein [Bdellovibrionales bacterium]
MKSIVMLIFTLIASSPVLAATKCANWVKLSALDWAKEVLESDLESARQLGTEAFSLEFKSPVSQDKAKNPRGVFEAYSIDWQLKFKDKSWAYSGLYFFDENCHRMKVAEISAGKEAERRAGEKKGKK